jgi:CubicO group peptidase (beta-lactamase class C family)
VRVIVALTVLATAWASLAASSPVRAEKIAPPPPGTIRELDDAIAAALIEDRIPGMSVAVIENGALALVKGYGVSDVAAKTPVTPETLFRSGSVAKSFIAIAATILIEEGKLSLDTPLTQLAPEIPVVNPFGKTDPVRLVHLMEHTAGWADLTIKQFGDDGRGFALADGLLRNAPFTVRYRPGQFFSYSNPAAGAAALMVERAAGRAFDDFVRERIFAPLGMASATYLYPDSGLTKSYRGDGRTEVAYQHLTLRPVGALNLTASELAKLPLLMLGKGTLGGVTLMKPESADRIETATSTLAARSGLKTGYGLFNMPIMTERAVFRGHDGAIDGAAAAAAYWPGHGAGYAVMWNVQRPSKALDLIQGYLTRSAPKPVVVAQPLDIETARRIEGVYQEIVSRQPLATPLTTLLNYSAALQDKGRLIVDGAPRSHIGGLQFQGENQPGPGYLFLLGEGEPLMLLPTGALQRVPERTLVLRTLWMALFVLAALFSAIHLPIWIINLARRRISPRGGVGLRFLPLLALASLTVLTVGAILALNADTSVLIERFSRQTDWSLGAFVLTVLIPIFGFLSFWRGLTAGYGAPLWLRLFAMGVGALVLIGAVYLLDFGWIGLKTWAS